MPPFAHAADWFMGLPALIFVAWLLSLNVRDRLSRRKEKNDPKPDKS